MSTLWEDAQIAIAEGKTREAHVHLAKLLKQEPKNSEAWFMLSTIVPSAGQQEIFLKKALKIDPNHEGAKAYLESLSYQTAAPAEAVLPISTDVEDLEAQAEGGSVPAWMAGSTAVPAEMVSDDGEGVVEAVAEMPALPEEPIPDWLKADPVDEWTDTPDNNPTIVAPPPKPPAKKQTPKPKPVPKPVKTPKVTYSPVLIVLILMVGLVGFFFIWTLLQALGLF
jgi:hypothetical protein